MGFENGDDSQAEKTPAPTPNFDVVESYKDALSTSTLDRTKPQTSDNNDVTIVGGEKDNFGKHQGGDKGGGKSGGGGGGGGDKGGGDKPPSGPTADTGDKFDKHQGPSEKEKPMTPGEIADSIIKSGDFGAKNSEDRQKLNDALGDALEKGPFASKDLMKQINDELALKGSKLRLHEDISGGGGGGGGRGGEMEKHEERNGHYSIMENGKEKDNFDIKYEKSQVFENGKLVGERSSRTTDPSDGGSGGGGWGKAPKSDPFKLDDFKIEDGKGGGGGGGKGGGGGGGGKGGGKTMPG